MRQSSRICSMGNNINNGKFVAVEAGATPYIKIWRRNGSVLTDVPAISPTPTYSTPMCIQYSPDGTHLVHVFGTSPYVAIYKRVGNTYTKLTSPLSTMPTSFVQSVSYSADGVYMMLTVNATPFILFYKRNGDVYTKLTNPTTIPTATCMLGDVTLDGVYFTCAQLSAGVYTPLVYKRTGDTWAKLTSPTNYPTGTWNECKLSPLGTYLFIVSQTNGFRIYKRSGDTFTSLLTSLTLANGGEIRRATFNRDETAMVMCGGYSGNPQYALFYSIYADAFTHRQQIAVNTNGKSYDNIFSKDGKTMFMLVSSGSGTINTVIRQYTVDDVNVGAAFVNETATGGTRSYTVNDHAITLYEK